MKKNTKFTVATVIAAAITLSPVLIPSTTSFASIYDYNDNGDLVMKDPDGVISSKSGTFTVVPMHDAYIVNINGMATGTVVPAGVNSKYTATVKINGEMYYQIAYDQFVSVNDVIVVKGLGPVKDYVTVGANAVTLYDGLGSAITKNGVVQKQAPNSVLTASRKIEVNGVAFYQVSDTNYLKASDVTLGTGAMEEVDTTPEINAITGVVTINYVPGYGIQVWTQKLGFVKDEFGANKKLAHNTSWKVFAETTIDGKTYYNLGGDQWVDAAYATLN